MEKFNQFEIKKEKAFINKEKLECMHNDFSDFFAEKGVKGVPPFSLIPEDDNTLLLTNSTMAPFKDDIAMEKLPENGIFLIQQCLRSNDQNALFVENANIVWPSYFFMMGVLISPEKGDFLLKSTIDFFDRLKIPKDLIYIKTSDKFKKINMMLDNIFNRENILFNTENDYFYDWEYGISGIKGNGLTFCYKQKNGNIYDLGNIISFVRDNRIIGWEMAMGTENFIAAVEEKNVFQTSMISDVVEYKDSVDFRKIEDSVVCLIEMINEGISPSAKREGFILRKYIKASTILQSKVPYLNIKDIIEKYCFLRKYDCGKILEVYEKEKNRQQEEKEKNKKRFLSYYFKNKENANINWVDIGLESFSLAKDEVNNIIYDSKKE